MQWFTAIDDDRSGQLTATQLQSALGLGGLALSLKIYAAMIRQLLLIKSNLYFQLSQKAFDCWCLLIA